MGVESEEGEEEEDEQNSPHTSMMLGTMPIPIYQVLPYLVIPCFSDLYLRARACNAAGARDIPPKS